jgi:hypothetical protein
MVSAFEILQALPIARALVKTYSTSTFQHSPEDTCDP